MCNILAFGAKVRTDGRMDGEGARLWGRGPLVSSFPWRLSPHLQVIRALMENGCCSWRGSRLGSSFQKKKNVKKRGPDFDALGTFLWERASLIVEGRSAEGMAVMRPVRPHLSHLQLFPPPPLLRIHPSLSKSAFCHSLLGIPRACVSSLPLLYLSITTS